MGDVNVIGSAEEKMGGFPVRADEVVEFRTFMTLAGVSDAGFSGSPLHGVIIGGIGSYLEVPGQSACQSVSLFVGGSFTGAAFGEGAFGSRSTISFNYN